jgi:O-antigen/teichoic acid export membrane protein
MSLSGKIASTAGVQALGMALLFVLHVLMTRILGVESYGTYVYIFAWVNVAAILGKFGADRGLVRLISRSISHGDFDRVRAHLKWAMRLVAGFTLLAGALAAAIFVLVEGVGRDTVHLTGAVGFFVLIAVTFSFLQKGALLGLGAAATSKIPTEVMRPLFMIVGILVLAEVVPELGAADMMWLTLFAYILVIVLGQVLWQRLYARARAENPHPGRDEASAPTLRDFGHFAIVSASQTVMRYTDVLLVGAIAGPKAVAYYAVAARIVSLIAFLQRAASPVVQPIISRAYTSGEQDVLRETVAKATMITVMATMAAVAGLFGFGREVLSLFGPGFDQATMILQVLLVGQVVNVFSGPNGVILSMTDNQNVAARALWFAAGVNIVGNLALIWQFGALGAAIATAASVALWNLLLVWACRVELDIDPSVLGALQFLRKQT